MMPGGGSVSRGGSRLVLANLTNSVYHANRTVNITPSVNQPLTSDPKYQGCDSVQRSPSKHPIYTGPRDRKTDSKSVTGNQQFHARKTVPTCVTMGEKQNDYSELTPCKSDFRPAHILDIDAKSDNQYIESSQYAFFYHQRCIENERASMTSTALLERHPGITAKMREILIDWLVDVHGKYRLNSDVIFRTVSTVDRFLEKTIVSKKDLQLVGITALWIAAKLEQQNVPDATDLAELTEWTYTTQNVAQMEAKILGSLNFCVSVPHSLIFVRRLQKLCTSLGLPEKDKMYDIARYAIELALLKVEMLAFRPSETAAAAVLLAFHLCATSVVWDETWVCYSGGWTSSALEKCETSLFKLVSSDVNSTDGARLEAVKRKFSSRRYGNISTLLKQTVKLFK